MPRPKNQKILNDWGLDTTWGWRLHKAQEQLENFFGKGDHKTAVFIPRIMDVCYQESKMAGFIQGVRASKSPALCMADYYPDDEDPFIEAAFPWRPGDDGLWWIRWSYLRMASELKTLTVYAHDLEVSCRIFITDIAWDLWAVLGCRGMLTAAGMDILRSAEECHRFRSWVNLQTDYNEDIPDYCLTLPPRV